MRLVGAQGLRPTCVAHAKENCCSWNPVDRICADVADLNLPGMGHIECRSLRQGEAMCRVPPEVGHDRIGYIVVEIASDFSQGTILGFVPTVAQTPSSSIAFSLWMLC